MSKENSNRKKRLRLVKVVVQPTFVVDDGDTLTEVSSEPIAVTAEDWPDFPKGAFIKSVAEYEKKINQESN